MVTANTVILGLLLLAVWVVMADIRFTVGPRSNGVLLGQDVLLDCVAVETSGVPLDIQWTFDGSPTSLPQLPNNSLYIAQVSRSNLGVYVCVASVTGQPGTAISSLPASLVKACIEDFMNQPNSVTALNGTTGTLECVSGYSAPPASVWWEKDGVIFTQGHQDTGQFGSLGDGGAMQTSMKLEVLTTTDLEGAYVCVAYNVLTAETIRSRPGNLTVIIPPEAPTFSIPPPLLPIGAASQPLTLDCVAAGFPQPAVDWYVDTDNGSAMIIDSDRIQVWENGSLHFEVLEEADGGTYECRGANVHGVAISDLVVLTVAVLDVAFVVPPSNVSVMGGQPVTLQCVPPRSVPSAHVIWYSGATVFAERAGEFAVRVLDDGALHFKNVQITDDGRYFCVAVNNYSVPSTRTSQPATISVHAAPLITEPPVPQRIIKGRLLTLTCGIQGRPTPTVRWFKDNEVLGPGDRITFQTERLLVRNTNKDDEGMYRCQVSNSLGNSSSASVLVFVVVPPQVVKPPQDATMRAGTEVLVPCHVYGDPAPTVTWTKDGTELAPGGRVSIGPEGVTLRSARGQDEGTYTCHAVNEGGNKVASGTLRIEVKPKLITYPADQRLKEGQPLALYCHGTGYPPPHYYWLYNGSKTLPVMFNVNEGGRQLEIPSVERQHAGRYTCVAGNVAGEDSYTTSVLVLVQPQISTILGDLVIDQGDDLHLTCDVTGSPLPAVTWAFNWDEVHATPDLRVTFPKYNELLIQYAHGNNSGRYQCEAKNDAGTDKTNVKVYVRETPFPPTLTSVHAVSMTSVSMKWEAATQDPNNKLTSWVIQYKESISHGFITYRDNIPATLRTHEVGGLQPFTEYVFRVAAKNHIGTGLYSAMLGARTLESAPSAPRNLQMLDQNATAVSLQWEVPADTNGIIRAYQVHYRRKYKVDEFQVAQINSPYKTLQWYVVGDLDPYTTYEIKVRGATIERGRSLWGEFSKPIDITTRAAPPSAAPPTVKVRVLTSRAIRISWQALPASAHRGILQAYTVQYRRQNTNIPYIDKRVAASQTETNVTGLLPWRHYDIRIAAINQKGKGVFSDVTTVRTNPEVPTGPPTDVQVAPLSATSITVRWRPIPVEARNSEISGYVVEYENARIPGSDTFSRDIGHAAADNLNLTGLLPYTEYRVRVRGFTTQLAHGFGPSSPSLLVTTLEGVPGPVRNLTVTVFDTSAVLTWEPPETPNGLIRNYRVTYYIISPPEKVTREVENNAAVLRRRREVGVLVGVDRWEIVTEATKVTVTGLRPNDTYSFQVVAETAAGRSDTSHAGPTKTVVLPPPLSVTQPSTSSPTPETTSRDVSTTIAMVTDGISTAASPGGAGTDYLPIILGASIGGAAVLLILLIIASVCCYRRAKHKKGIYFIPPPAFAQQTLTDMQIDPGTHDSSTSSANTSDRSHNSTESSGGETQAPSSSSGPTRTTSAGTQSSIAIREGRPGPSLTTGSSGATSRPLSEAPTLSSQLPRRIPLDPMFDLTYSSLDDLRMAQLVDNRYRGSTGIYLVPPQVGLENPAYDSGSVQDVNSIFAPHTDSTFLRSSTVYTSQHDLYAQVNLSKRRKNRMKSQTAAAIAAQKNATSSMFLDTDALIKNDSVVVYDERTAL